MAATDDIRNKSTAELLAIKRAGHVWTPAERAILHGDVSPEYLARYAAYDAELVRRLDAGEHLTKADKRRARQLKRESAQ